MGKTGEEKEIPIFYIPVQGGLMTRSKWNDQFTLCKEWKVLKVN